ncbi:hypothetical protein EDD15DRAFT_2200834 [Pisolithus albus]|nr:hypothetical protein EDD15DRAFT_2200834 [Pisolithus albus]
MVHDELLSHVTTIHSTVAKSASVDVPYSATELLAAARQTFAFAPDRGLPLLSFLYRLTIFTGRLIDAVWIVILREILLSLLAFVCPVLNIDVDGIGGMRREDSPSTGKQEEGITFIPRWPIHKRKKPEVIHQISNHLWSSLSFEAVGSDHLNGSCPLWKARPSLRQGAKPEVDVEPEPSCTDEVDTEHISIQLPLVELGSNGQQGLTRAQTIPLQADLAADPQSRSFTASTRLISRIPLTYRMNADNATASQMLLIWQCKWHPDFVIEGQSRMRQARNSTKK